MANFEHGAYRTRDFQEWVSIWRQGASDWADGSLNWQFPVQYDRWNFPYACGICKRGELCGVKLHRCNGCKVTHYCCQAHQKKAWPIHKQVCKHFRTVLGGVNETTVRDAQGWKDFLLRGFGVLYQLAGSNAGLDGGINSDEWHSQRHCQVCFYNPAANNTEARSLVVCPTCACAAHCSEPACEKQFAQMHTAEACEHYLNGFAAVVMSMQQGTHLIVCCQSRATEFRLPSNWNEYFQQKLNDFEVHEQLLLLPPVMGMVTDGLSLGMTLLNELTTVLGAETMGRKSKLTVHLLGTEINELMGVASRLEEMLHWLPACIELDVLMVFGNRELYESLRSQLQDVQKLDLCAGCKRAGATLTIRTKVGYYHELYTAQSLAAHPPGVVMACHSGMHDMGVPGKPSHLTETWEPTIRMLAHTDIPCIFTGYNAEETVLDGRKLRAWGARVVTEGHINPFRGLRPFPEATEDNAFYYTNQSCIVTRGGV